MKKSIFAILFLFLPLVSHASFTKDLYYGVRGDAEAQALQEFLADQGHYAGAATGNFFSLTLSAVKKFQIANNISPASGYFGPKTRAKANQILETAGISADSIKDEDNVSVSVPVIAPKTTNDVVVSLANQIALLQQQLATLQKNQDALQQQNQSLQVIQQQQAAQTQQITQQTQTLQQIQANTAPLPLPPIPAPTSVPQVILHTPEILEVGRTSNAADSWLTWIIGVKSIPIGSQFSKNQLPEGINKIILRCKIPNNPEGINLDPAKYGISYHNNYYTAGIAPITAGAGEVQCATFYNPVVIGCCNPPVYKMEDEIIRTPPDQEWMPKAEARSGILKIDIYR